jgi:hypothetical protein
MNKRIVGEHEAEVDTTPDPVRQQRLEAWLAEYNSLRAEIEWLIEGGAKYQNFAITLLGLLFTAIAWVTQNGTTLIVPTVLVIPFLFTLLGFLYCRQHEEVYVVASYLKQYVRPRLRSIVRDESLWGWEEFKASHSGGGSRPGKTRSTSAGMVLVLRSMLFVVPSLGSIIAVIAFSIEQGFVRARSFLHFVPALFLLWFVFDLLIVSALIFYLLKKTHLPERLLELNTQPIEPTRANQTSA